MVLSDTLSLRPVAGGVLQVRPRDESEAVGRVLPYEVWVGSADAAWVELRPEGAAEPVRLDASAITALKLVLDNHTTLADIRSTSVGIRGGDLSLALRHDLPLFSTSLVALTLLAVAVAALVAVRGHRRVVRLRALTRHEAESREAERTRVSREIHDGALQDLAALARSAEMDPEHVRDRLRVIGAELRTLAADLRPPALDQLGLGAALADLADRWSRAPTPLVVRTQVDAAVTLDADVELALYRATQEALTNAARHGRSRTAWVFLHALPNAVALVVRDDGVGLGPSVSLDRGGRSRLLAGGHFGLAGIAERIRGLGGSVRIGLGPGRSGTEVSVRVPVGRPSGLAKL